MSGEGRGPPLAARRKRVSTPAFSSQLREPALARRLTRELGRSRPLAEASPTSALKLARSVLVDTGTPAAIGGLPAARRAESGSGSHPRVAEQALDGRDNEPPARFAREALPCAPVRSVTHSCLGPSGDDDHAIGQSSARRSAGGAVAFLRLKGRSKRHPRLHPRTHWWRRLESCLAFHQEDPPRAAASRFAA